MHWERLLLSERVGVYQKSSGTGADLRSEFEKDYHRIIGSSSFRRLQDKTQVFALDKSDFIRTRLTHSLEVSSFAKSLGQNIARTILSNRLDEEFTWQHKSDICDILQCAGLIHDIGNPPFGHFGEEAIRDWFQRKLPRLIFQGKPVSEVLSGRMRQDLFHFEGNAQALRQVSRLHFLVNENGMNLTFPLLDTIIKYPVSSEEMDSLSEDISHTKMGYFYAEEPLYRQISKALGTENVRHPLTFILEAADDIAYKTADIEDAFKKGFISYEKLREELVLAKEAAGAKASPSLDPVAMLDHQYENAVNRGAVNKRLYAVQNFLVRLQSSLIFAATDGFISNYSRIMEGTYKKDLFYATSAQWVMDALGDIAMRYAFLSRQILSMEVSAGTILDYLLDRFVKAVIDYDTQIPLSMMNQKLLRMISENYRQVYHIQAERAATQEERLYLRLLLVTDFISGMTDTYAKDLYQKMNGIV
ncbi:MAG: deoxyguanosinetriphosphate triphosphohydrolase [Blautia sp.]|nr:deoxyguanosinetriphosphate triphosphohydrolase [Blautia sp.]